MVERVVVASDGSAPQPASRTGQSDGKADRAFLISSVSWTPSTWPRIGTSVEIERRLVHGPRVDVLLAAAEDASELVVGKHGRVIGRDLLLDTSVPTIVVGAVDTLVPLAFAGQRAER